MKVKKIEFKDERWQFDEAMLKAEWDEEVFDWMIAETMKSMHATEINEFWKQYNEWKRQCGE